MISTNVAYCKLIDKHKWSEERVTKIWDFRKPITWRLHVIKAGWCSRSMLRVKEFIWRVRVGALPLGDALKKSRNITKGSHFFCSMELEHSRHRFLSRPMARMVWRCISLVWMSLTGFLSAGFLPDITDNTRDFGGRTLREIWAAGQRPSPSLHLSISKNSSQYYIQ